MNISHLVWCTFSICCLPLNRNQTKSVNLLLWRRLAILFTLHSFGAWEERAVESHNKLWFHLICETKLMRTSDSQLATMFRFGTHENFGNLFISLYYIWCFAIHYVFKSEFIIQSNALIDSFGTLKDLRVLTFNMMNDDYSIIFSFLLFILRFAKIILCNRYRDQIWIKQRKIPPASSNIKRVSTQFWSVNYANCEERGFDELNWTASNHKSMPITIRLREK